MSTNIRPVLKSFRPTVNRQFLTDEQLSRRLEEILNKSIENVGEGTVISTGVHLALNKIHSGEVKADESLQAGLLHGGLAGAMRALYEFGKDLVDTNLTGRLTENKGEYAPDLQNPKVRQAIVDTIKAELRRGEYTELKDGYTTPTLSSFGLYIKE